VIEFHLKEIVCPQLLPWGLTQTQLQPLLAPADDIIIKVEHPVSLDPTGQLLASILSKKKSIGATHCLIDIPIGRGTKMPSRHKAMDLKRKFIALSKEIDLKVNPDDLRIDTYRSSGAGGQHVNVTDSAVRITHLPTGVVVSCQDERSQIKNRAKALRVLKARIMERMMQDETDKVTKSRRTQVGTGDRSEKIRTYNFPERRVTEHRINFTVYRLEEVLEGDLGEIVKNLIKAERQKIYEAKGLA